MKMWGDTPRRLDSTSMLVSFLGVAMPNFWLGPLLIILFSLAIFLFAVIVGPVASGSF